MFPQRLRTYPPEQPHVLVRWCPGLPSWGCPLFVCCIVFSLLLQLFEAVCVTAATNVSAEDTPISSYRLEVVNMRISLSSTDLIAVLLVPCSSTFHILQPPLGCQCLRNREHLPVVDGTWPPLQAQKKSRFLCFGNQPFTVVLYLQWLHGWLLRFRCLLLCHELAGLQSHKGSHYFVLQSFHSAKKLTFHSSLCSLSWFVTHFGAQVVFPKFLSSHFGIWHVV